MGRGRKVAEEGRRKEEGGVKDEMFHLRKSKVGTYGSVVLPIDTDAHNGFL